MGRSITEVQVFPPLIPNAGGPGRPSDHNIVFVGFELVRKRNFKWMRYSYLKYTKEGDAAFGQWIIDHKWDEIVGNPSEMAQALGNTLDEAMSTFFPLITRRLRLDQDPWINLYLEKLIDRRRRIFKIQGHSKSWKKVKKRTEKLIPERKRGYLNFQVEKVSEKGGLGFASWP